MSVDTKFHQLLKEKIEEEIMERESSLSLGIAQDYADYRYRVGYIAALKNMTATCEEVEKKLFVSN